MTRNDEHGWSGVVSSNLDFGTRIRRLEVGSELLHDGDADPGVQGDLVPEADTFQRRWYLETIVATEEPRENQANSLRRMG